MSETLRLAERVSATRFEDLDDATRVVLKQALLDFVGVAIAGMEEPLAQILLDDNLDQGGNPQSTIIATSHRLSASQAALVNGAAGHAHDYDDVHTAMTGHPTVPVAPVVLALGERLGRCTEDMLAALSAGIDVECILGRYAGPSHYAAGWHATGTLGAFGAAAAAARLHGLDAELTAAALGIAGTQAAGLKSQFGTMCKPLHAGNAASIGVRAAALASRGFTSRNDILETTQGFMDTQSTTASTERFDEAMQRPAYAPGICFKYHAACYLTHSSIEAANNLSNQNAFDPKDIKAVEINVDEGHLRVANIPEPCTGLEAKFSLRFTAAMALAGVDTSSIDIFTDELTQDPVLAALRDKVTVVPHEAPNPKASLPYAPATAASLRMR